MGRAAPFEVIPLAGNKCAPDPQHGRSVGNLSRHRGPEPFLIPPPPSGAPRAMTLAQRRVLERRGGERAGMGFRSPQRQRSHCDWSVTSSSLSFGRVKREFAIHNARAVSSKASSE
ncbi:hypothetical protein AAFF_G00047710 [Aldrovandia affinis]|uniref:Uncharacterized protein n=1 Tax=Aldrovandia affinis TaxID=143900 RepID=A0AAD7WFT0_9TELE|nr:hypothetical protein AAFF_G00047710 [Aldrovandia affinis]